MEFGWTAIVPSAVEYVFCGGIVSGSLFLSFLPRVSRKCLVLVPNYLFPDCWILFIRIFIIWS